MSFYNFNENEKLNVEEKITELMRTNTYKYVYISIGSKHNKDCLMDNNGCSYSNAYLQMLPTFLFNKQDNENILVIIFDRFETENNLKKNKMILKQRICKNMDIIVMNILCNAEILKRFIPFMCTLLSEKEIDPNNTIIANYVKFANIPNQIEELYQQVIPNTINNELKQFPDYVDSFYQWFGYEHKTLYNMIYRESGFDAFSRNYILTQLSLFLNDPYSNDCKFTRIHNYKNILSQIIDLSCPMYLENEMFINLNEFLVY